jgi:hypothetical protein
VPVEPVAGEPPIVLEVRLPDAGGLFIIITSLLSCIREPEHCGEGGCR